MKSEEEHAESEDEYYSEGENDGLPEVPSSRVVRMEWEAVQLIIRQIVFVFVFEVMFVVTLANRYTLMVCPK